MDASETHDTGGAKHTRLQDSFATPRWLRDLGRSSWLLVGLLLLLLGLIWLLAETYTITGPMVCALIVSVVAMPVVRVLDRHMPRAIAAALVLVAVAAIAVFIVVIVVAGITGQSAEISAAVASGVDKGQGWLKSAGVDSSSASGAASTAKHAASGTVSTLVHGVAQRHPRARLGRCSACRSRRSARSSCSRTGSRCGAGSTATSDCRSRRRA